MNTTASFLPEPSWSRRCSTETVFSIQGRETDIVQDSSDSEVYSDGDGEDLEYEPATESEEEAAISGVTSGQSDAELLSTQVVKVAGEESDRQLADSEYSHASDSEAALPQYDTCARCRGANDNKPFRYCDKCFRLRKNFFPPRPKRKKHESSSQKSLSQDSGVDSHLSQEQGSSQEASSSSQEQDQIQEQVPDSPSKRARIGKLKRRSESADRATKRPRLDSESDNESSNVEVAPLVKTISDPAVTIESLEGSKSDDNLCIICLSEPKSGVFVHRRVAHICCCYTCAVKVWSKARRCPICNCKVSNVLKAVVL